MLWQLGGQSCCEGLLWKGIWRVERGLSRGCWEGKGPGNRRNTIFRRRFLGCACWGWNTSTLSTGSSTDFCPEQPNGMVYLKKIPWLKKKIEGQKNVRADHRDYFPQLWRPQGELSRYQSSFPLSAEPQHLVHPVHPAPRSPSHGPTIPDSFLETFC